MPGSTVILVIAQEKATKNFKFKDAGTGGYSRTQDFLKYEI